MQIQSNSNRLLGNDHIPRNYGNGPCKTIQNQQMEPTKECHRSMILPRIQKLLSKIYRSLFGSCEANEQFDKERERLDLDRKRITGF